MPAGRRRRAGSFPRCVRLTSSCAGVGKTGTAPCPPTSCRRHRPPRRRLCSMPHPRVNLEEPTKLHRQLAGKRVHEIPTGLVAAQLVHASYLGHGSFCRVWKVDKWSAGPSAARGKPVVSPAADDRRISGGGATAGCGVWGMRCRPQQAHAADARCLLTATPFFLVGAGHAGRQGQQRGLQTKPD